MTCPNCGMIREDVLGGYCGLCLVARVPMLKDRLAALEAENARLREENERLKASVAYWQGIHGPRHEGFGHKGKE